MSEEKPKDAEVEETEVEETPETEAAPEAEAAEDDAIEPTAEDEAAADAAAEEEDDDVLDEEPEAEADEEEPEAEVEDEEPEAEADEELAAEEKPARRRRGRRRAAEPAEEPAPKPSPRREPGELVVVRAQAKYVRTSARKARLVCDHIRGKSVQDARAILAHTPRAVARDWSKLLESAVANAEHNHELLGDDLRIAAVTADEGPTLKRYRPRAMGRATRIRKRTSHLTIMLTPKEF
jgi:large subunit ribosomal protein L22